MILFTQEEKQKCTRFCEKSHRKKSVLTQPNLILSLFRLTSVSLFKPNQKNEFWKIVIGYIPEMETDRVDRHRSGRPAGRVAGRVEILPLAGQAGRKTGRILLSGN